MICIELEKYFLYLFFCGNDLATFYNRKALSFCHFKTDILLYKNERLSFLFIFVAYGCKGSRALYSPDSSSIFIISKKLIKDYWPEWAPHKFWQRFQKLF